MPIGGSSGILQVSFRDASILSRLTGCTMDAEDAGKAKEGARRMMYSVRGVLHMYYVPCTWIERMSHVSCSFFFSLHISCMYAAYIY